MQLSILWKNTVFFLVYILYIPFFLEAQTSPPTNDAFANRLELSGPVGQATGTNNAATKEDNEPNHAGNEGGSSVWWTWTAAVTGSIQMNTRGSDFDTLLAIYTGNSVSDLTVLTANDDTFGTTTSSVTFTAQEGQTYHIAVDGFHGVMGNSVMGTIVLTWSPSSSISGRVTAASSGDYLSGVRIEIVDTNGDFVSSGTTDETGMYTTEQGFPAGTYFAATSNFMGLIDMVYSSHPCTGFCAREDLLSGTPIEVGAGANVGRNFQLAAGRTIAGRVTEATTGQHLAGIDIDIVDTRGRLVSLGFTDDQGNYTTENGLPAGRYFAYTLNFLGFIDAVYEDHPCIGLCSDEVSQGTPIVIEDNQDNIESAKIHFVLARGGTIPGKVTDATTGLPLQGGDITLRDSFGNFVSFVVTDDTGSYRFAGGLAAGMYFASASNFTGFFDAVYKDQSCFGACTVPQVLEGMPIPVSTTAETPGIDFALQPICQADGNVDEVADLSPNDALLAWQYFLNPVAFPLSTCQQSRADVSPPLGVITPADARCIFRRFLGLSSC